MITTLVVGGLLAVGASDGREDVPAPTDQQIAESVSAYSIEGSVELLVAEDPATQTLTLGSDVLFAFGSSDLDDATRTTLEALIADLPDGAAIGVEGHTDSRGGDAVNIPLSEARAQAVADVISAARRDAVLTVAGRAATQPVAEEYPGGQPDYDAMAQNRRVTITVTG